RAERADRGRITVANIAEPDQVLREILLAFDAGPALRGSDGDESRVAHFLDDLDGGDERVPRAHLLPGLNSEDRGRDAHQLVVGQGGVDASDCRIRHFACLLLLGPTLLTSDLELIIIIDGISTSLR